MDGKVFHQSNKQAIDTGPSRSSLAHIIWLHVVLCLTQYRRSANSEFHIRFTIKHLIPTERFKRGATEMNRKALLSTLAILLLTNIGAAIACEYKAGETKFIDYANCRFW